MPQCQQVHLLSDSSAPGLSPPPLPFWHINLCDLTLLEGWGLSHQQQGFWECSSLLHVSPSTFLTGGCWFCTCSGSFLILKGERKLCYMAGRTQRETHHQPSHTAEGTSSTPRTVTAPGGRCLLRLHWQHHSIPQMVEKKLPANRLQTKWHYQFLGTQHLTQSPEKGKSKLKSFISLHSMQLSSSCMMCCRKKSA